MTRAGSNPDSEVARQTPYSFIPEIKMLSCVWSLCDCIDKMSVVVKDIYLNDITYVF